MCLPEQLLAEMAQGGGTRRDERPLHVAGGAVLEIEQRSGVAVIDAIDQVAPAGLDDIELEALGRGGRCERVDVDDGAPGDAIGGAEEEACPVVDEAPEELAP